MHGLMTDKVNIVKPDGTRHDNVAASVQPQAILVMDGTIPIEPGDIIERRLPSGVTERFEVIDPGYIAGPRGSSLSHYEIKYQRSHKRP